MDACAYVSSVFYSAGITLAAAASGKIVETVARGFGSDDNSTIGRDASFYASALLSTAISAKLVSQSLYIGIPKAEKFLGMISFTILPVSGGLVFSVYEKVAPCLGSAAMGLIPANAAILIACSVGLASLKS